jgi:hypothetical protein
LPFQIGDKEAGALISVSNEESKRAATQWILKKNNKVPRIRTGLHQVVAACHSLKVTIIACNTPIEARDSFAPHGGRGFRWRGKIAAGWTKQRAIWRKGETDVLEQFQPDEPYFL